MTITIATVPPAYIPALFAWDDVESFNSRQRPYEVTLDQVFDVITPTYGPQASTFFIEILGEDIEVINPQFTFEDEVHPMYFEVVGATYHFTVSIWRDYAEIEVLRLGTLELLSTMFPKSNLELRLALDSIVRDYQNREALAA